MMGPWLLYGALLNGACLALFQGSPLGRPFGEFVAAAGVTQLGLVPSIARVRLLPPPAPLCPPASIACPPACLDCTTAWPNACPRAPATGTQLS
jgi:hypothetical protein